LVEKDATSGPIVDSLIRGMKAAGQALNASSSHILYLTAEEQDVLSAEHQLMPRLSYQFHWENQGWESFDAYIACFRRSARRNVQKERQQVRDSGLTIRMFEGKDLENSHWDALWSFYMGTASRKGAIPYLTREFFEELKGPLKAMVMVGMALDGDHPVAGTLSLAKGTHLYGRYWGTEIYEPGLHFELCYYLHIEACIARGWTRFEAGAQGQHKLKRGLLPSPTYSVHWIRDPSLADAVSRFLDREQKLVRQEMAALARHSPFKRDYPQA
jgi:predicted N-acyltransferase